MLKVLIATDGSEPAHHALNYAGHLLVGCTAEVTLLHVIPQHMAVGSGGPVPAECYDLSSQQVAIQDSLDGVVQRLAERGVGTTLETEIGIGDPADVILAVAQENEVDLIILGRRGMSAMARWLLGSVSEKVTRHAPCAVLLVPPILKPARAGKEMRVTARVTA